jgi:S-adenosylmethionine synthetase
MEQVYQVSTKEMNKMMIYFAHTSLCIYSKTINCKITMSIDNFRNANEEVIKKIQKEAKRIFNCELTCEQINRAIDIYFIVQFSPLSATEDEIFEVERSNLFL